MNSLSFTSSLSFRSTYQQHPPVKRLSRLYAKSLGEYYHTKCCFLHRSGVFTSIQFHTRRALACAKNLEEGPVAVVDMEDLGEKDWSFLGADSMKSKEEHDGKVDQIICAGNVVDTSKILVSMGSDDFVDRLIQSSSCKLLLVAHDSFLSLACIKERHDKVKCWQGGFLSLPEKWASFDVVFLYFLPAFPFKLEETFEALASRCAPGARIVISHLQGRQGLEQQKLNYPDNVISDLPSKLALEMAASNHSFVMKDYIDDPSFYLATLEFKG